MSAQQQKTSESKAKSKFQSLNINNIYQGAANKPSSKNLPAKHGLQSLGKVPTARRAPVNLPSEKSEKGGNDPSVVLVPTGGGWANKEGEKEGIAEGRPVTNKQSSEQSSAAKSNDVGVQPPTKQGTPPSASNKGGAKSWSSVTGSGQSPSQEQVRQKYLHQKSPLFGQEFPSLPGDAVPAGSQTAGESMSPQTELTTDRHNNGALADQDPAYGPGPNLRPQTFGTWSQGGKTGGPQTETGDTPDMSMPILPPQPHKPQPPHAAGHSKSHPTTQFKSIMPPFMDAMELPAGPPQHYPGTGGKRSGSRHNTASAPRHSRDNRARPDTTASFTNHSIIDREKLQRMDDLDNGNDWTYEDDDFDYNKKLESDDDDIAEPGNLNVTDPNWADQLHGGQQSKPYNSFYDDFKSKPVVGFDDEDSKRTKKSEEVMKNIERARQRREEEENRYRQQDGDQRDGGNYRQNDNFRSPGSRGFPRGGDERFDARDRYYDREDSQMKRGNDNRRYDDDRQRDGWDTAKRFDDREISPGSYQRHDSEISATESLDIDRKQALYGSVSPEWGDRNSKRIQDWVEDVEEGEKTQREEREHDRPSRPDSRDSRVSRGSKGSRASKDRELNFSVKKEDKSVKKPPKHSPMQDIRGYFRDEAGDSEKKQFRHAPGPITKEKLESFEMKESMTQLRKRDNKTDDKKVEKPLPEKTEPTNVLSSLLDSDLLENISEDDDILDLEEDENQEMSSVAARGGRGSARGKGRGKDEGRPFVGQARGGKIERVERGGGGGARGGRGGRGENKRVGQSQNKWSEGDETVEIEEEKKTKKIESLMANPQPNPSGFMPRGQPSRRGRGEGRVKQGNVLGRQKIGDFGPHEDIGEWGESGAGRGKAPPRMQKSKKERPGSGAADDVEEWETASETSLEERDKRSKGKFEHNSSRGRGGSVRGGRGGHGQQATNHWTDNKARGRGSGNAGSGSQPGAGGSAEMGPSEEIPEAPNNRAPGNDQPYAMDHSNWAGPDMDNDFGAPPPNMRDRRGQMQDNRMSVDKKLGNNKGSFDRRTNKLPPRLAKQREVAKAQARTGPGQSPSPGTDNGWPDTGEKIGVFNVDTGTGAWEKPLDGPVIGHGPASAENGSIQQTMVFENTAYKGGKGEKIDKAGPIQLPLSFSKQDSDNADLKLDFTFGGEESCLKPGAGQPPLAIPKSLTGAGLPASPSTDDLQTKLANTKKLWDAPGMPAVPENSAAASWNETDLYGESNPDSTGDKSNDREAGRPGSSPHTGVSNIAKVKPQQQMTMDSDVRSTNTALQYNRMAVPSPPGSLPPSQLTPFQPWALLSDASRNPYNPYTPLNQSILMPGHNLNTDLFTSHNTLRGVQGVPAFPGTGLTTTNQLMSQANLINSQGKLGSGIGPIGTKAGAGAGPSSPYLANLTNTNSNNYILYDNSGNPLNYLPNQAPPGRGNPPAPSQTAFYQSIAAAANRQQAQAYNNALHAANAAQLRANAVAGMAPYQKLDQTKSPVSDTGYNTTAVPPYNGRANNHSNGPPSPKTKLKLAQQQEQAKLTASMGNMNMNNLNALAQMQRSMQLGHFNNQMSNLVQQQPNIPGQYNPSPIARPQVSHSQGAMMTGGQLSKQMNHYFNQEGAETTGEEALTTDKVETEETVEELPVASESSSQLAQPAGEQEAGVAN